MHIHSICRGLHPLLCSHATVTTKSEKLCFFPSFRGGETEPLRGRFDPDTQDGWWRQEAIQVLILIPKPALACAPMPGAGAGERSWADLENLAGVLLS